jgi:flagellar protein FliL
MAEEAEAAQEGGEDAAPKKKIPMWIFILFGGQVVLLGGGIAAFVLLSGKKEEAPAPEAPTVAEQKVDPTKVKDVTTLIGPQFNLEPFVVNLIEDGRGPRYLKIEIKFELEGEEVRPEIDGRLSQIRNEMVMLLSSKRMTDVESPDGKRILQDEIFTRVNKVLVTGRIKRVFFTEFVIQ